MVQFPPILKTDWCFGMIIKSVIIRSGYYKLKLYQNCSILVINFQQHFHACLHEMLLLKALIYFKPNFTAMLLFPYYSIFFVTSVLVQTTFRMQTSVALFTRHYSINLHATLMFGIYRPRLVHLFKHMFSIFKQYSVVVSR